jgi:hypothetical protein
VSVTSSSQTLNDADARREAAFERSKRFVHRFVVFVAVLSVIGFVGWMVYFPDLFWLVKALPWAMFATLVVAYNANVRPDNFKRWRNVVLVCGTLVCMISLCCCFDADSTVWRRSGGPGGAGAPERVAVRDLAVGDIVLSADPSTGRTRWEPVLARAHFSFLDGGSQLVEMRTLVLERNLSRLTLSDTHFVYTVPAPEAATAAPRLVHARDVLPGDHVMYCAAPDDDFAVPVRVARVETGVWRQKRAFFLPSPHVLVDSVVASPYMGAHPAMAEAQHAVLSFVAAVAPHGSVLVQVFVTSLTVPYLLANRVLTELLPLVI